MIDRVTLFGFVAAVGALVLVLELVRQRRLSENHSLLWLATAGVLMLMALLRPVLDQVALLLGVITYPPAALFMIAIIFVLFLLLQVSVALTRLTRENKQIAQELALLRQEMRRLHPEQDGSTAS